MELDLALDLELDYSQSDMAALRIKMGTDALRGSHIAPLVAPPPPYSMIEAPLVFPTTFTADVIWGINHRIGRSNQNLFPDRDFWVLQMNHLMNRLIVRQQPQYGGAGVESNVHMPRGHHIGVYSGIITKSKHGGYMAQSRKDSRSYINAEPILGNDGMVLGRINEWIWTDTVDDPRQQGNNVKFHHDIDTLIVASQRIRKDDTLWLDYGPD